jgi:hypothetical protein
MKPSSDIEISDVTLPIAALLIASVFEQLDGCRIENSSSAAGARKSREAGHCSPGVLIRPDGHVAWVGDLTDARLPDALTTWFGPPTAR